MSSPRFAVEPIVELPDRGLLLLLEASEREGFRFVRRVVEEWRRGIHRFDGPGERLLGAFVPAAGAVGLCGLMRDPYTAAPAVGRLRNLYVLPAHRRGGIGAALTRAVVDAARGAFRLLRLRAGTPEAARLYERLGFAPAPAGSPDCTHVLALDRG